MKNVKRILFAALIALSVAQVQPSGTITYVACHQQQGTECGYFALLHALEELGNPFAHIRITIDEWKNGTTIQGNVHSETIEHIRAMYSQNHQSKIFILDSKNDTYHLHDRNNYHRNEIFIPAVNRLENNEAVFFLMNLGTVTHHQATTHWIMVKAERNNLDVNLTIKDSMASSSQSVANKNNQPLHVNIRVLQQLLEAELIKRNREHVDAQFAQLLQAQINGHALTAEQIAQQQALQRQSEELAHQEQQEERLESERLSEQVARQLQQQLEQEAQQENDNDVIFVRKQTRKAKPIVIVID